jgi:hypothetical protein
MFNTSFFKNLYPKKIDDVWYLIINFHGKSVFYERELYTIFWGVFFFFCVFLSNIFCLE